MLAVPPAVQSADPRLAEDATQNAGVLVAVAPRVSNVARARHAVVPPTAEATPAVETPAIARAAALVRAPVLLKAPVATGVAMQANAELDRAHDVAPEIASAERTGPAAAPHPPQRLTQPVPNVPISKIAKAAQAATHASVAPMKLAPHAAVAAKAVVKNEPPDLASAKAAQRVHRDLALAVRDATHDAAVAKATRGVVRALAVKNAVHDLASAKAAQRAHRDVALAARGATAEAVREKPMRGVVPAQVVEMVVPNLVLAKALMQTPRA